MGSIYLQPELVTSGGETCGILRNDHYIGSLTILYREEDRLYGSIQLDQELLSVDEKEEIDQFIQRYVQDKVDALNVQECMVTVTYSEYDHIVSTDLTEDEEDFLFYEEEEYDLLDMEDEEIYVDVYEDRDISLYFEMIRDDGDSITYDIYEDSDRIDTHLGRVTVTLAEELTALVDFIHPRDLTMREQIAYRLIDELEEEIEFDTLTISMQYDDEIIDEYTFDIQDQDLISTL